MVFSDKDIGGTSYEAPCFFLFLSISSITYATTYLPTPIHRQISSADAAVSGIVNGITYKKLPGGEVVTEVSLEIEKSVGLDKKSMYNPKAFKFVFPGGRYHGKVHWIKGSPEFQQGEHVFILVKEGPFGNVLHNFGLGKYGLFTDKRKTYLKSDVFSDHKSLGRISMDKVSLLLEDHFRASFETPKSDVIIAKVGNDSIEPGKMKSRGIASLDEQVPEAKDQSLHIFWFVLGLAILGVFSTRSSRNKR